MDSTSDQEPLKKKPRFQFNKNNVNKSESGNVFSTALENTSIETSNKVTDDQIVHQTSESESNNDSKIISKSRPKFVKAYKQSSSNKKEFNIIDLKSDASKKIIYVPLERIDNILQSLNEEKSKKTKNDQSNSKKLNLNEQIARDKQKSKNIQNDDGSFINTSSDSVTKKNFKKRPILFKKQLESEKSGNTFDAVFDSDNSTKNQSKNSKSVTRQTSNNEQSDLNTDDSLTTPNPAQSTLSLNGKPLTCITRYFHPNVSSGVPVSPIKTIDGLSKKMKRQKQAVVEKNVANASLDTSAEIEVDDVTNGSIDGQVLDKQPIDIPESSSVHESDRQSIGKKTNQSNKSSAANVDVWVAVRKNTDKLKTKLEKQFQKNDQKKHELALKEANIQAKLNRQIKQEQAKKRRLNRKPLDKAYYVNGRPYKQPKLLRPKKWVTTKLYNYLGKCLEPKFGIKTRLRSEEFVKELSEVFDVVVKRKLYKNYKTELNDLMMNMTDLGIIETRHDFWRFCSEFMPPSFKDKAVPMLLPGNVPNIPFDPDTGFEPLID